MITAVGFTGSLRAGRAIFDAAAARPHPIPVYAEMGSVNPVFILPGAMKKRGAAIAEGLKNSVTLGVGQFCTNPGVVVTVGGDSTNAFMTELANQISKCPTGTMLNENIGRTFAGGVKKLSGTSGVTSVAKAEAAASLASHATAAVFATTAERFAADASLREELFGPATLVVTGKSADDLRLAANALEGQLTATVIADESELAEYQWLVELLQRKVGRLILNGYPTGVEVCPSIHHGGPYPATTDSRATSVGTAAIDRFARPICYQDFPAGFLPAELKDGNPLGIWRLVDNQFVKA
jgi:NADP-dependent aldehyde dehydrogenase